MVCTPGICSAPASTWMPAGRERLPQRPHAAPGPQLRFEHRRSVAERLLVGGAQSGQAAADDDHALGRSRAGEPLDLRQGRRRGSDRRQKLAPADHRADTILQSRNG